MQHSPRRCVSSTPRAPDRPTASQGRTSFARILVAFDGSAESVKACDSAAAIAGSFGSEVTMLYVIPPLSSYTAPLDDAYYSVQTERAEALIEKGMAVFARSEVEAKSEVVRAKWSIVETIIDYATDHKVELILMGARGMGGFKALLIGSVSNGVVAHADCPVMIVR